MKAKLAAIGFFLALLLIWEGLVRLKVGPGGSPLLPEHIVSSPVEVVRYLIGAGADGTMLDAMVVTIRRLFIGYFLGIALGLPLGLLTARFRFCEYTLGMVALGLQTLPSICWVPLAILWFKFSETAMLFVVLMGSLWSVLLSARNGVKMVPPIYLRAARTMGSRRLHTWTHVIVPASLPFIVSGMKQGWAFAWRSLMAAEIYVSGVAAGLGYLLENGRNVDLGQVVGIMLVIILIGLATDKVLFSPWEAFLHRRWGTARE